MTMDAKDEAAALQRHPAELETRKLEMEARHNRLSLRFSALAALCRCAAPSSSVLVVGSSTRKQPARSIDGTTSEQASFQCIVCKSEFGLRS